MIEPTTHHRATKSALLLVFGVALALLSVSPCFAQYDEQALPRSGPVSRNPFNSDFSALTSEFERSSPPKQAVLVSRGYKLRGFVDRPGDIALWLTAIANDRARHPLVRDEAARYLASIDVNTGNLAAAEARLRSLGLIRAWSVASGPGSPDFKPIGSYGPQLWLDLSGISATDSVNCAATSIYTDSPRTVALRFGSDSAINVSVNGVSVFRDGNQSPAAFDQHVVAVHLASGWNSILLQLTHTGDGPQRFALRITGMQGGGIPLKASATREPAAPGSADLAATAPQDLVEMAKSDSASDPRSADKLQTLGMIELGRARGSALDHLQAAARRESSARLWLEVAAACGDMPCTFTALNAALHDDPKNERATSALADYYVSRNQLEKARDLLRTAISLAPDDFVARERLAEIYALAGFKALALKQTRELLTLYPDPLWLKMKAAQHYSGTRPTGESIGLLRSVLRDDFDNPAARKLLASLLRRIDDATGVQSLLEENARLNPRDPGSLSDSQTSAFAHRPKPTPTTEASDSPYLESAEELAAAARRNPPADNASVVALSDTRVERVLDSGLSSVHVQQIFYIATEQGARQYASQPVQYAPATQELRILRARVHKADGRIVEGTDGDDSRVADAATAMYYDVRSREVRFPGVEKGDVVELDYRITPTSATNPYGDYFGDMVVFRTSLPERLKRYVLIAPFGRKLNIVEKRMTAPASVTETNGERVYRWQERNLPALVNETRGPGVTEIAPYVHVSTFASWSDLGHWYAELIRPQFQLDSNLRDVAAQIVVGKKTEFDKIDAIYQFVLRNTHYVALEFGIYSYKPYPVTQTYERRFGDCKDKASLIIALLREAGIDADLALLRTRRMGEIDPHAASISLFNHAIVYVPKWDLWLDGTAEYFSPRELPIADQGAMALVVAADGTASLRHVPITRPEDNYTRRTVRAVLETDGTIRFKGETYTRGEDAPGLRREYEITERQRDSVRNNLAQVFPSVRVYDVRVHDANDPEQAVNVDFSGTIDSFADKKTATLATSWMERSYVQPLAPLPSRGQELTLPAPWTTEEELHFQLPAGAKVASLPANTDLDTQFGSAHIRYEKHGREIVIRTSLQFRALRIAPADYAAFRDFCRSVEHAFRNQIKVNFPG